MAGTYLCDTCGGRVNTVRRDVVDRDYNALSKPPLWNCEGCYQGNRRQRTQESASGETVPGTDSGPDARVGKK